MLRGEGTLRTRKTVDTTCLPRVCYMCMNQCDHLFGINPVTVLHMLWFLHGGPFMYPLKHHYQEIRKYDKHMDVCNKKGFACSIKRVQIVKF